MDFFLLLYSQGWWLLEIACAWKLQTYSLSTRLSSNN